MYLGKGALPIYTPANIGKAVWGIFVMNPTRANRILSRPLIPRVPGADCHEGVCSVSSKIDRFEMGGPEKHVANF
jgi:hypothetical protein